MSQGSGGWWRRRPRGGGRRAVPSGADTAGGERLRGQGWESGQVTARPEFHCMQFHSDPYSCSPQRLKSEACWGLGALDPSLSMSPQLPKASPNPALHTSLRDGQRRGAVLIR